MLGTKFGAAPRAERQSAVLSAGSSVPTGLAAVGEGALAFTGADVATLAGAGLAALALGGIAYAAGRREDAAQDRPP